MCLLSQVGVADHGVGPTSLESVEAWHTAASPSDVVAGAVADPALRAVLDEVLTRNPRIAGLTAAARAAEVRAPQARALPDPTLGLTAFVLPPETRTGPQLASLGLSQKLPWPGKRKLHEETAVQDAQTARARVETARLEALTEARRLYYELAFAALRRELVEQDRATLEHFEELARARYSTGVGLGQAVVKIHAEITRAEADLLDIDRIEADLLAELNALRDRPRAGLGSRPELPPPLLVAPDFARLREQARSLRPEIAGARSAVASRGSQVELARQRGRPDLTAGLSYTAVGRRDDPAGRANPPQGNGDDILALSLGINLPLWRSALAAGIEEAVELELAAEASLRAASAEVGRELAELERRLPLLEEQLGLYEDVLLVQVEESLHSALAGYSAGTASVLDLLDAERVRLQVKVAAARIRADYAIAIAELERVVAGPVAAGGRT
jgi:outer membrane protein TolC